ncbi:MAG: EpsG family protein [Bacteroidales bacterium]|nr:EpsG family protein [Bacteroidales bacterium]
MIRESVIVKISIPALFLISFILHFATLNQTPYANGWDGYYYIMQAFTFIEKGAMRSPDYSPIYPYYIILSFITKDYILAFKIGSAILSGILTISAFIISQKFTKDTVIPYLISAFLLFSPTLYYFASQFPKNLMGVIFFIWFVYFLIKKKMLWSGIFFLLGFMTHRMIAGLSVIIILVSFIKELKIRLILPFIAIAVLLAFLLPGLIHIADIDRFTNLISECLYIPPLRLIDFFGKDKLSIAWKTEIILLYLVFVTFIGWQLYNYIQKRKMESFSLFLIVTLLVLSFPIYTFTKASIGFRFYLVFVLLSIFAIQYIAKLLPQIAKLIFVGIVLLASVFSYKSYNLKEFDPPYESYFNTMNKANSYLKDKDAELIIAHQALAQIIIIYSDYNATNWQPVDSSKYESMWRITSNIKYYYFKKYLDENDLNYLKHLHGEYYIIREDIWQKLYKRILKTNDLNLISKFKSWYNPVNPKPEFLLRRRSKDYIH